jgi:DinB superfamily/Pentapeptide repeats (8 copies)
VSYQDAQFVDVNMSGALFREVDLSGVRMRGVYLENADIDGAINGLRVNGVEVAPLIKAELDRMHPERTKLRPTDAAGALEAWAAAEAMWEPTMARAAALTDEQVHRSVDDEWSFVDTLRHLVFARDLWFGHAVLGLDHPFHPLGLPHTGNNDFAGIGLDLDARPSLAEIAQVRAERSAQLKSYLDTQTDEDFLRVRTPAALPWRASKPRPARDCLQVVFNEEWAHHQFAIRDLDIIEAS